MATCRLGIRLKRIETVPHDTVIRQKSKCQIQLLTSRKTRIYQSQKVQLRKPRQVVTRTHVSGTRLIAFRLLHQLRNQLKTPIYHYDAHLNSRSHRDMTKTTLLRLVALPLQMSPTQSDRSATYASPSPLLPSIRLSSALPVPVVTTPDVTVNLQFQQGRTRKSLGSAGGV